MDYRPVNEVSQPIYASRPYSGINRLTRTERMVGPGGYCKLEISTGLSIGYSESQVGCSAKHWRTKDHVAEPR